MKTIKRFLILAGALTLASVELQAQQPIKKNEFKIGMFGLSCLDSVPGVPYCRPTFNIGQYTVNTSTMNVMAEDGFNVVQTYYPDEWTSEKMVRNVLKLFNNNNLQAHLGALSYYKPDVTSTQLNPFGENTYDNCGYLYNPDMSPYASHMFRPNYKQLAENVYSDPQFRKTIWGFHVCEEASYYHWYDFTCGPASQNYMWQDPNYFKYTEVPPTNVRAAVDWFKGVSSSLGLGAKTILMEAKHNGRYDDGLATDGEGVYNPQDYVRLIDRNDPNEVYFEGSYVRFNIGEGNSWMNEHYNDYTNNYLGEFRSVDYARSRTSQVHKVLNIEGTDGDDGWKRYSYWRNMHSDSTIANANWLWFQAYTSIIHKVKGVWFWDIRYSWYKDEPRPASNNVLKFERQNFPQTYQRYVAYLAKELRYLVNNNVISTDGNTVVATKTDQADALGIVPPVSSYIPSWLNDSEHNSEHYGLRYTIRCNGKKTYMIITNPLNATLRNVPLNFANVANQQIRYSTGVKVLFDNGATDVASHSYKTNRNNNVDLVNNNPGNCYTVGYAAGSRRLTLSFGPLDVKVLEFVSDVPNHNNGWSDVWSNFGSNWINGHQVDDRDNFLVGDFNGDGAEELFCVSGAGSWMTLLKYNNNDWQWYWSNYGDEAAGAGIVPYRNNLTVGDFDGDGRDEVVGCAGGWITVFKFRDGDWHWHWSNYGNTGIAISPYSSFYAGDFDGDGKDELLAYGTPDGWTTMFKWNGSGFSWAWSDYGTNHAIRPYRDNMVVGDYDGDGKDELLGVGSWNTMFHYENGDWNWGWSCYGSNDFGPITTTVPSAFVAGNVDNDRKDELFVLPTRLSSYSGSISNYARLLELANNQSTWNSNWTPSVAFIDDWPITNTALQTTRYLFVKARANRPAYLLAFRKYGNSWLVNMYSKSNNVVVDDVVSERDIDGSLGDRIDGERNNVVLSPNPTTGMFRVKSDGVAIDKVQVLNMTGNVVFEKECQHGAESVDIDLSGQQTGVYQVLVTDNQKMTTTHSLIVK